jgi:uracil-DNA glycosylase
MTVKIEQSWQNLLKEEFQKEYFINLADFVKEEYKTQTIYPKGDDIFKAFDLCPVNSVKVVLLGQDPYHGVGQAHGLCFSVKEGVSIPPSLRNIYKELFDDIGKKIPDTGNIEHWAKTGVLMLNATLTVRAGHAGSHQNKGWETFTDAVIRKISDEKENIVFILWGAYAQKKGKIIDESKHYILKSAHPSPRSAYNGFFGNKHFSKTNLFLKSKGISEIIW